MDDQEFLHSLLKWDADLWLSLKSWTEFLHFEMVHSCAGQSFWNQKYKLDINNVTTILFWIAKKYSKQMPYKHMNEMIKSTFEQGYNVWFYLNTVQLWTIVKYMKLKGKTDPLQKDIVLILRNL